jgi:hypothetical protein
VAFLVNVIDIFTGPHFRNEPAYVPWLQDPISHSDRDLRESER